MTDAANAIKSLILAKAAPTLLKSPTHDPESSARPARTTRPRTPSVRPSEWPRPSAWLL